MTNPWPALIEQHPAQPLNDVDTFIYPIQDQQLITVTGPDSAKFMQGQFSCNLSEVTESQYRRGACCNAKGRMVTSFNLAKYGEDYLISMNEGLAETALAHLKKYMVFFKTQMTANDWVTVGIKGPKAESAISQIMGNTPDSDFAQVQSDKGIAIKLPFEAGYELWLEEASASTVLRELTSEYPLTHKTLWSENLITHGLAQLTPETTESLIPQMMNLGVTGGISFNKGCYTGQEIVARMQYLGKLKRHGYVFKASSSEIMSGAGIFTTDKESSIGEVVNVSPSGSSNESLIFAVVEDKYLDYPLTANSSDGPSLELLSLPYDPIDSSS